MNVLLLELYYGEGPLGFGMPYLHGLLYFDVVNVIHCIYSHHIITHLHGSWGTHTLSFSSSSMV